MLSQGVTIQLGISHLTPDQLFADDHQKHLANCKPLELMLISPTSHLQLVTMVRRRPDPPSSSRHLSLLPPPLSPCRRASTSAEPAGKSLVALRHTDDGTPASAPPIASPNKADATFRMVVEGRSAHGGSGRILSENGENCGDVGGILFRPRLRPVRGILGARAIRDRRDDVQYSVRFGGTRDGDD